MPPDPPRKRWFPPPPILFKILDPPLSFVGRSSGEKQKNYAGIV